MAAKVLCVLILASAAVFSTELNETELWDAGESEAFEFDGNSSRQANYNLSTLANKLEQSWSIVQQVKVDYIVDLLCLNRSDYRFYHILVDRTLETPIADEILRRLSACVTAGILTTE